MSENQDRDAGRDSGRDSGRDPIGTVADEARKLFESIQGRATRQVGRTVFNSFTGGGGRRERDVWEEAVSEPHGATRVGRRRDRPPHGRRR
jgi:hypothetical protein